MNEEDLIKNLKIELKKFENKKYYTGETRIDLMIIDVLSVLQKQKEELEKKDYKIHIMKTEMERPEKLKIELNKKDKVIEELVDKIYRMDYRNEYGNTRNQIKENFYKKVEKKR